MRVLFVTAFVVIVDQISKIFVKGCSIPFLGLYHRGMTHGESIPLIGNVFNITFVENPGIAFGIDFGTEFKLLISIFTILASIGLFVYLYLNRHRILSVRLSLALILGGAMGNLIDRIFYGVAYGYAPLFYGKVVDFFNFRMFNLFIFNKTMGSYVFNVADIAVTTGVLLLLFAMNREKSNEPEINPTLENYLAENKE